ncbi:cation transporting ATPase, putative [Plasmodium gallinaceum]|uniref:Cation transporting ATPase, putative n=1 Tax=Plasmodium gallinaceum TaxID=5849 RepID=A0A1J1GLL3_PLAGA|nr:cation transporting ATPase, putative [Plasmodium gallinaceum]CRG93265.1 cation transporting ATPase, putative [Plasmodium gallinaceum]
MNNKYNVIIYKKRKTHCRLDVLLFLFYAFYLNFILQNKKFEAQLSDYEYIERLKLEKIEEENIFKFNNSNISSDKLIYEENGEEITENLDGIKIQMDNLEREHENTNYKIVNNEQNIYIDNNKNDKEKILKDKEEEETQLKPIILGKYNLIYIFYSIEFLCLLLFIFFHLMIFLLSQWNLNVYLFIAFKNLNSNDKNKYIYNLEKLCTHVYIKPLMKTDEKIGINSKERFNTDYNFYKPKAELVELKKLNNDIFFFYKQKKYLFDYKLVKFESLKHFDIFNVSFYLKWKGLIECEQNLYDDLYISNITEDIKRSIKSENLNDLFNKIDILYSDKARRKDIKSNKTKTKLVDSDNILKEEENKRSNLINDKNKNEENNSNEVNKSKKVHIMESQGKMNENFYYNKSYFQIPHDLYVNNNLNKYGENIYDIPSPCFKKLLYEAMLSPFFIFQFFSIILWMLDSYWYFGIFSIFILIVLEAQLINKRIREFNLINSMKVPAQNVYVYRNMQWKIIKSNMLLPGDIYILANELNGNDNICTCETLLIEGICITDESILTGESIPLIKAAIDKNTEEKNDINFEKSIFLDKIDIKNKHKKNIVYAGTNVLLTKNDKNEFNNKKLPISGCVGIVLKNGFTTYQGKLVRTIINTSEKVNSSGIDSIVFLLILLLFSISSSAYVVYSVLQSNHERNLYKLVLSVSHIITAVIPPEFPITLSLAVTISIVYLYNLKIYCTEPFRLPFSGKSKICAFDKTGTLTEDNMIVLGLFGLDNNFTKINELKESIVNKQRIPFLSLSVIAGCHSICTVNNKLLGDPLEKNSFLKLKCNMKSLDNTFVYTDNRKSANEINKKSGNSSSKNNYVENFQIYKRFFFSSELQRMTCITFHEGYENDWFGEEYEEESTNNNKENKDKTINENMEILDNLKKNKNNNNNQFTRQYLVVSKGSPEIMKKFLKKIPANYDQILDSLSIKGYRVLCLAANVLDNGIISKNIKREEIEKDLYFCGFLAFICPIKKLTPNYILDIKRAGIKNIMITGDNALTACQVSLDVNIIPPVKIKDILILKLKENYLTDKRVLNENSKDLNQDEKNYAIEEEKGNKNEINKKEEHKSINENTSNQTFTNKEKEEAIVILNNISKRNINLKIYVEKLIRIIENNKNINNILYFVNRENKKVLPFIDSEEYIKLCGKLFSMCITGDIIEYFLQNIQKHFTLFDELIKRVHVFCRVSPKNKEIIIKTLNKLGNITIMCGDGTNDMAALKAAHVGISLLSIKISYKNNNLSNNLKNNESYLNNNRDYNNSLKTYENHLKNAYDNLEIKNRSNVMHNNMNYRYYEQMKLYNERKKKIESMMQSMDDSLPLIKLGEASIASPFTYKGNDIKCVKEIICCGRCALSKVIMMYKLMIINSLITAFSVSILTLDGVKLSDAQTTIISLLYTTLIVLISKSTPLKTISNYSPPTSLFNISVIASLIFQVFVHFSILVYGWKLSSSYRQPDYVPDLKGEFTPNLVNTCIYYLIYCINLSIFSCNYEGLPFMTPIHKNKEIVYIFIVNFIFLFSLVMNIFPFLNYFFSLVSFPNIKLKFLFLFLMILDIVIPYLISNFIRYFRLYFFQKFKIHL